MCAHRLQKTKIPARGLKPTSFQTASVYNTAQLQKTKIPARGLKPTLIRIVNSFFYITLQKTKIPARGLKPIFDALLAQAAHDVLQKTKIPARGLKLECGIRTAKQRRQTSKNQNPREGIETNNADGELGMIEPVPSKNQNPREGIETASSPSPPTGRHRLDFKKPKSPRGD